MSQYSGYEIIARQHESRRSLIFRARRVRDGLPVIIKTPAGDAHVPGKLSQVRREFEIGSRFQDQWIARYHELIPFRGGLAIVVEDFGGVDLGQKTPPGGMDLSTFLKIAIQLAAGLGIIHRGHVIHKDIKPGNIIIKGETVKWIDFGLSSPFARESQQAVSPHALGGTLAFMSPEQTGRMNRPLDYRSDFYSLGMTFYQLLTGLPCFQSNDPMELVHWHLARVPRAPLDLDEPVARAVSAMVLKLVAKDPGDRYQSADGLEADLRVCLEAHESGAASPLTLGEQDVCDRFMIPDKLYGRDKERDALLEAFDKAAAGNTEMLLIFGQAGVGKSALVNEIQKPLTGRRGYFASGKFDELNRSMAYSAVAEAFRSLTRQILSEDDRAVRAWKQAMQEKLGANSRIILELVPELESWLGQVDHLPELGSVETRNRFELALRQFVSLFADADHPLVLFLDDLQWADTASLDLIGMLMSGRIKGHLLLIGAFRDNEVGTTHPLRRVVDALKAQGRPPRELSLKPIQAEHLTQLAGDTLGSGFPDTRALADTLFQKTGGNPFFAVELLKKLHADGHVFFNYEKKQWQWDREQTGSLEVSANVVFFLVARLQDLSPALQHLLALASCIGEHFDLTTLAAVADQTREQTLTGLWDALQGNIVVPLDHHERLYRPGESLPAGALADVAVHFRFQHDRVREAAASLIDADHQEKIHYRLGQLMLDSTLPAEEQPRLFEIVGHLNVAKGLLKDSGEILELSRLNLAAGRKAAASSAYQQALDYCSIAVDLLPEDAWDHHYELALAAVRHRCLHAYHCGRLSLAESLIGMLLEHARSDLEKAGVYLMRVKQCVNAGDLEEALAAGFLGLKLLGIRLPGDPGKMAIRRRARRIRRWWKGKSLEGLAHGPLSSDPKADMSLQLLMHLSTPAYLSGRKNLLQLFQLAMIESSLQQGIGPFSAFAFIEYAVFLAINGQVGENAAFGRLALELCDRFEEPQARARVCQLNAIFVLGWNRHWRELAPIMKQGLEAARQSGDLIFVAYISASLIHMQPTRDLASLVEEGEDYLALIQETSFPEGMDFGLVFHHFNLNLSGLTEGHLSLSRGPVREEDLANRVASSQAGLAFFTYHLTKLRLCFLYGELQKGYHHMEQADRGIDSAAGTVFLAELCFYAFLNCAALAGRDMPGMSRKLRRRLKTGYRQMKHWAKNCPDNFLHQQRLMEAELARLQGRHHRAAERYDEAIEGARRTGFPGDEALAHELAAGFYLGRGRFKAAAAYFKDALRLFSLWGAEGKAAALRQRIRQLDHWELERCLEDERSTHQAGGLLSGDPMSLSTTSHSVTTSSSTGSSDTSEMTAALDHVSVMKSSLAIASEISLHKLLAKMMEIMTENAGARHGLLILEREGRYHIEATAGISSTPFPEEGALLLDDNPRLPTTLVRYVLRTGKEVLLEDAAGKGPFHDDPYLHEHAVRSALCLPIRLKSRLLGVVYLENKLVPGAFTSERVATLNIILHQAAVSLENAMLFEEAKRAEAQVRSLNEDLEKRVAERTAELESAQKELVDQAHQAGMANIATSVLHNVGNILNSIGTSSQVIQEVVNSSRLRGLTTANRLLRDQFTDILRQHPKGEGLLEYYTRLECLFKKENREVGDNIDRLVKKVNAIRDVVMAQQQYAAAGFRTEKLSLCRVVDDALLLYRNALERGAVTVEKHYRAEPMVRIDKAKLIHILINLIKNALEAMTGSSQKKITVLIEENETHAHIRITDSGHGIEPGQLEAIFTYGFTTKRDGHGFGLHGSANAMTEMGGRIWAESEATGQGAAFVLQFPLKKVETLAE
ncbi:MAG: AAA family ATPase [Acidobacteriota bacterium]|nr:AAA family ATPase [Acidobacteriota bacterium]